VTAAGDPSTLNQVVSAVLLVLSLLFVIVWVRNRTRR
jgi:hypothetical protein